jgi:hypothetical protein
MGSWSHLIPSIGPGKPVAHARQRRILGRAATIRLVALNAGVGLASVGVLVASTSLIGIGIGLTLAGGAAGLVTFGQAVWIGVARTNRT